MLVSLKDLKKLNDYHNSISSKPGTTLVGVAVKSITEDLNRLNNFEEQLGITQEQLIKALTNGVYIMEQGRVEHRSFVLLFKNAGGSYCFMTNGNIIYTRDINKTYTIYE